MRDPNLIHGLACKVPLLRTALVLAAQLLVSGSFISGPASAAQAPRPPDLCDKRLFAVGDVRDILTGKPTINHYSMSESTPGEGCTIGVTGNGWAFVDLSLREGDPQSFQNLTFFVPQPHNAVAGVGDEALGTATKKSNVPNARETDLFARKGRLQCIAQLHRSDGAGEKLVIPTTDGAVIAKLGALCSKLLTARSGP